MKNKLVKKNFNKSPSVKQLYEKNKSSRRGAFIR